MISASVFPCALADPDGTEAQSRVPRIPAAAKNDLVIIESSLFASSRPGNMNSIRNRSVL
jgi:hypothetical protein